MSKTPEELAEEYADSGLYRLNRYVDGRIKPKQGELGLQNRACKNGFLAGYQAAQERVSSSATLNNWISVKSYLPQPVNGQPALVLILQKGLYGWIHEIAYHHKGYYEWSNMLDEKIDNVHYWQELPEPPKEEG